MPLTLVVHDLDMPGTATSPDALRAFHDAIWELAPTHWHVSSCSVLLNTSVSPTYLRDVLVRALGRAGGTPGLMLVTRVSDNAAWCGLPAEGEQWLRATVE
ncbi:hypothetical protein M0638_13780 [Roseomonas sp. NAR14]|uniref:Uncharacterized protein n=1 Tax=Roseomonas acroporae TaxID=2937791 RepID=A0A9X1Y9A7_9PROT|nr:hypothetical protein [Roseomonas acroporae]MCK8785455.1 hypothetical protein [Roseomonas acroporae]